MFYKKSVYTAFIITFLVMFFSSFGENPAQAASNIKSTNNDLSVSMATNKDASGQDLAETIQIDFSLGEFDQTYKDSVLNFVNENIENINSTQRDYIVTVQYFDIENIQHVKMYPMEIYKSGWELPANNADIISLLAYNNYSGEWVISFDTLDASIEKNSVTQLANPVYSFPWINGVTWQKSQGFHSSTLGYSLDLVPAGSVPKDILSIEAGVLTPMCYIDSDPYQASVKILHSNGDISGYVHLDKATVPTLGFNKDVPKGFHLGVAYNGTAKTAPSCSTFPNLQYSTPCGCGTGPHVHFEANKLITIQGFSLTEISNSTVNISYTSNNIGSVPPITSIQAASNGTSSKYISITFGDTLGAERYEIFRNTINSSTSAVKIGTDTNGSPYNDTTASYTTTYYYWVRACNYYGCGAYSYPRAGSRQALTAPTDISLSNSEIYEKQSMGASVGEFLTVDPNLDETSFTYSLVSGAGSTNNSDFYIDSNWLKASSSFNYLLKNSYSIRVRTTDPGGLWAEKIFIITVKSTNSAPYAIAISSYYINEGLPTGSLVGYFSTYDSNLLDTHTYSLTSGEGSVDNSTFSILNNKLITKYPLSYLTKNSYSTRVRTTDEGGLYFEKVFYIYVEDMPGNFSDVPDNYWATSYIETLYRNGITGGCITDPLQYCPDSTVTRAQMAIFLLKGIHGSSYTPPAMGDSTGFGDVTTDYWAAVWIKQLAAEGITGGCGGGNYCPESTVTRAQMAVFLMKAKNGSSYSPPAVGGSTGFGDVATDYWAAAFIKQLVADGITSGCGTSVYCPDSEVTRAQMAVFLVKAFNLP